MRHAWLRFWLAEDMFRMNHLSLLYRVVLAGVLAGAALSVTQAGELPVAPFVARYEVYASGFALGEAVMRLDATGAQGYTMRSDVRPSVQAHHRLAQRKAGRINLVTGDKGRNRQFASLRDGQRRASQYTSQHNAIQQGKVVHAEHILGQPESKPSMPHDRAFPASADTITRAGWVQACSCANWLRRSCNRVS
jgi:hypothetical protein